MGRQPRGISYISSAMILGVIVTIVGGTILVVAFIQADRFIGAFRELAEDTELSLESKLEVAGSYVRDTGEIVVLVQSGSQGTSLIVVLVNGSVSPCNLIVEGEAYPIDPGNRPLLPPRSIGLVECPPAPGDVVRVVIFHEGGEVHVLVSGG